MILFNIGKRLFVAISSLLQIKRYATLLHDKAYINGEWVHAISGKTFKIINPATNEEICSVPDMDKADCELALDAAKIAFKDWGFTTPRHRSNMLKTLHELINQNAECLARLVTEESGKPINEARGEIAYSNSFVEYYAEEAARIHGEIIPSPKLNKKLLLEKEPIGVALMITAWNFPLCGIIRKLGAALAAGCTCIIKPSEYTPLASLALAELTAEACIPKGVVNCVTCSTENSPALIKYLVESPIIAVISLTGSTKVGKIIFGLAANGIKNLSLELGGDAPFIIFKSADLTKVVTGAMAAKFRNSGQTCIAANRFLVQEEIHDAFVQAMKEEIEKLKLGNGIEETTQIGPLIHLAQFNNIAALIKDAVDCGAKVITGGKPSTLGGTFYEPTLLVDVTSKMKVNNVEIFGPILSVTKFNAEQEAIDSANNTSSGLAAYVFSEDLDQIFRVTRQLDVGMIGVNDGMISVAEAPFGGTKESGIGREGSTHGMNEYTNIKFVSIGDIEMTLPNLSQCK